jgi:hypothetical protein
MAELVSEMPRKYPYFSVVTPPDKSWVAFVSSVEDMEENVVGLFTERDEADLSKAVYMLDAANDTIDNNVSESNLMAASVLIRQILERKKCDKLK